MGPFIALLAIIGFIVLWAFFVFPPRFADRRALVPFNWSVIGVCVMLCGVWAAKYQVLLNNTANEKWADEISVGGAIAIEIVFISICFVLRIWVFKPPSRPGF